MSAHQIFIHLVWTTLDRRRMINEPTRSFLDDYFKKTAARQDVQIVDVEILRTHVHMVVRTPPRIDLPRASVPANSTLCVNTCEVKQITIPVKVSFRTMSAEHTL